MTWNTDTVDFAKAVAEFEAALPGFWWSVGQCSVGAHASCAVDGKGVQAHLLDGVAAGHPLDAGFHADTHGGSPADALREVMRAAIKFMEQTAREEALREEIARLRAKVAKADELAMCLEDTVGYFAESDGLRKRAEDHLAAYREADT